MLPNPDYLKHNNAKSFLNFGITPDSSDCGRRQRQVLYEEGRWQGSIPCHLSGKRLPHFAALPVVFTAAAMEFMVKAFNMNTSLQSGDQIYQWRTIGSTIGFIGMFMFAVFFALWLSQMPLFRGTSRGNAVAYRQSHLGTKAWAWGCLIVNTLLKPPSARCSCTTTASTPISAHSSGRAGTVRRLHAGDFLCVHRHCHLHLYRCLPRRMV